MKQVKVQKQATFHNGRATTDLPRNFIWTVSDQNEEQEESQGRQNAKERKEGGAEDEQDKLIIGTQKAAIHKKTEEAQCPEQIRTQEINHVSSQPSATIYGHNFENGQLRVGADFKMMNLTQAQINVSKMIQGRDSEAAKRALEMSKQVQSNTMGVRDQIARIQQQVQMQKEKAQAQQEEQHHQAQSISIAALQSQNHQFKHNQNLQQQMLQRNPLSGTIQMNQHNSLAKPVQQQSFQNTLNQQNPPQYHQQIPRQTNTQKQQNLQQKTMGVEQKFYSQQNGNKVPISVNVRDDQAFDKKVLDGRKANQSDLGQQIIYQLPRQQLQQPGTEQNSGVRISKKKLIYQNHPQAESETYKSPPAQTLAKNNKTVKLQPPELLLQSPGVSYNNQEQGQLQISKKSSQIDSTRLRTQVMAGQSTLSGSAGRAMIQMQT